jgi:hypothetical protein
MCLRPIAILVAACCLTPASAQPSMQELLKMQDAMQSAQANASRPGDEELDCTALEREMVASVSDPALLEHVAQAGDRAAADQARMREAQAQMPVQAALTVFASLAPGGAWAQIGAAQAQMPVQKEQAAQRVDRIRSDGQAMMQFLPQMMRGQRVIELAQRRGCSWVPAEAMQAK